MFITIVSATPFEVAPLKAYLENNFQVDKNGVYQKNDLSVLLLITGVGMPATLWGLGQFLGSVKPDLMVNAGIAGAFDDKLDIGTVVHVVSEKFGDLGVEEASGAFTDMFDLGLIEPHTPPYINGALHNPEASKYSFLPTVKGLTVNKVHGSVPSIETIRNKYPEVQVESMEGAAFFYACLQSEVPFLEIRAVSNRVEARNRENWNLPLSIGNLNKVLIDMLEI